MLYIIKKDFFLADYILGSLTQTEGISIIPYRRNKAPKGLWKKLLFLGKRHLRAFYFNKKGLWNNDFFPTTFFDALKNVTPNDHVLFWGVENLKEMLILQKEINPTQTSFFLWNPVSTINRNQYSKNEYARYIKRKNINVYTFDKNDAKQYGLKLVKQVYRMPESVENHNNIDEKDVFFIGKDKKRAKVLLHLLNKLKKEKLSYYFHILTDKHSNIDSAYADCFYKEGLAYPTVLKHVNAGRCIAEILQTGQSGMTIRTLEALFFKKKLITNNHEITKEPFYHPNNIYIIGKDEERITLAEFINTPITDVPEDVLRLYQIEHWIKQFTN